MPKADRRRPSSVWTRSLVRVFILGLSAICAATGLAAWGGIWSARLDWTTHFAPLGLVFCALTAGVWRLDKTRQSLSAVFLIAGVFAWGALVIPEVLGAVFAERNAKGVETLRVVQFNLRGDDPAYEDKLAWLQRTDADVIVLEEVGKPALPLMAALKPLYPHKFTCEIKPAPCPVTVLSKRAPVAEGFFSGKGPQQANTAWGRFVGPGGYYQIVAVHIDRDPPLGQQRSQFATLTRQLKGFDKETTILAGDFNATPWSFVVRKFDKASGLRRRTRSLPTWPAGPRSPISVLPIDHVYAGEAWRTVRVTTGPSFGSDHLPVVVDLTRG